MHHEPHLLKEQDWCLVYALYIDQETLTSLKAENFKLLISTFFSMLISSQKITYGGANVSARVDEATYISMLSLAEAAGYRDVSTFVREACLCKCREIAANLQSQMTAALAK